MSIEFICPTCSQQLRVPDTAAGKNAKCPKCNSILAVPSGRVEVSPLAPPPQPGFNFAANPPPPKSPGPKPSVNFLPPAPSNQVPYEPNRGGFASAPAGNPFATDPGQYSPNTQATLPNSQMTMPPLQTTQQMMPVPTGPLNPYASPQHAFSPGGSPNVRVEVTPIVNHAIKMWQENLGVLLATTLLPILFIIPLIGLLFGGFAFAAAIDQGGLILLTFFVFYVALIVMQIYVGAGQLHVCMLVARGQQPNIAELFIGWDKFLQALGFALITFPIMIIAALPLYIPLIILLLVYWPSYYLIVDGKCGFMESFGAAQRIAEGNKLTTFLLALVTYGFLLLGELACFVGLFFAVPLVSVMWCTAYLMMSGQIPVPPPQQPPYPPQPPYGPQRNPRLNPPPHGGYLPPPGK